MHSHHAKPDIGSTDKNGWHKEGDGWKPTFFNGQSAAELLEELLIHVGERLPANKTVHVPSMGCPVLRSASAKAKVMNIKLKTHLQ